MNKWILLFLSLWAGSTLAVLAWGIVTKLIA